jgi:hypothetical protein
MELKDHMKMCHKIMTMKSGSIYIYKIIPPYKATFEYRQICRKKNGNYYRPCRLEPTESKLITLNPNVDKSYGLQHEYKLVPLNENWTYDSNCKNNHSEMQFLSTTPSFFEIEVLQT